jgi:hypothetical protein
MQEVAQGIDLADYETFNARLIQEVQRLDTLFGPSNLTLPTWLHDRHADDPPAPADRPRPHPTRESKPDTTPDPFEAFIEDLFSNDPDTDENVDS